MLRAVVQVASVEFRTRVRNRRLLALVAATVYLGHSVTVGEIQLIVGGYRGVYNTAWLGAVTSLTASTAVAVFGFYLVKNAIGRDRARGPGAITAATPVRNVQYLFGKWLATSAFLATVAGVTVLTVLVLFFVRGTGPFDAWALVLPFALLTLPVIALVAAAALLFEATPVLRTGIGNVAYLLVLLGLAASGVVDPVGGAAIKESVEAAIAVQHPSYDGGMYVFGITKEQPQLFRWSGLAWTRQLLVEQLAYGFVAVAMVVASAIPFDRFDPARRGRSLRPSSEGDDRAEPPGMDDPATSRSTELGSIAADRRTFRPFELVVAELRLLVQGRSRWWYLGAGAIAVAGVALGLDVSRGPLLAVAWIWPLLVWSELGAREQRHHTIPLVVSTRYQLAQVVAAWLAGATLAALLVGGVGIRLLVAGHSAAAATVATGVLFVPAFALASGTLTRTSRAFEIGYLLLWYLGPMNRVVPLDYGGLTDAPPTRAAGFAVLAVVLLGIALLLRHREVR